MVCLEKLPTTLTNNHRSNTKFLNAYQIRICSWLRVFSFASDEPNARAQRRFRAIAAPLMALLFLMPGNSDAKVGADDFRIFIVGNSMSKSARGSLKKLFRAEGYNAKIVLAAKNGFTLARHLQSAKTFARFEKYDSYDAVIIQEQSAGVWDERMLSAAAWIGEARRKGATPILSMTWADRGASAGVDEWLLGLVGGDSGYLACAAENQARLAPIGVAFREASKIPDLESDLWARDGHHAGRVGKVMIAVSLYREIVGVFPTHESIQRAEKRHDPSEIRSAVELARLSLPIY
jgi:hypothetical protein